MPLNISNVKDIVFTVDGILEASTYYKHWPFKNWTYNLIPWEQVKGVDNDPLDFITIYESQNFTLNGKGLVDGLGYKWWVREWAHKNKGRPNLLRMERVQTAEITGLELRNSPRWTTTLTDIDSFYIHDM